MDLVQGKIYENFELLWIKDFKEIGNTGYFFRHKKNNAELLYLKNDDINKVFTVGFKTLPEDSCGTPHILEHSVLNGSRKYPVKEPFMELVKGSLKTFVNAFTASDKTMYPVASTNQKDFMNLMDVYLDAVYFPKIYDTEEIFLQEGWHHEIFNKEDAVIYNGVVYNEMKGAFSSPESMIFRKIQNIQNPDNCYQYESGGDPAVIPELSYEKFLNFHRRYYHPSNSYICLYGNLDLEVALKKIDNEYLTNFEALDIDTHIAPQEAFQAEKEETSYYPVAEDDALEDKAFVSVNYTIGNVKDATTNMAFSMLSQLLLDFEGAPLKEALLKAGLGQDIFGVYNDSILQPVFSIVVKNTNEHQKAEIKQIIDETLKDLICKGIDKKLIEAVINSNEFSLREADTRNFPKGLFYQMMAFKGWMHCDSPELYLQFEERLETIKKALTEPYFETLVEKFILNNNHKSTILLLPKKGMNEEAKINLDKKLSDFKANLSDEDLTKLIEKNNVLRNRQQTPDAPEELAKVPHIELEDINPKPQAVDYTITDKEDYQLLELDDQTNKIAYLRFDFNAQVLDREDWKWLGLLNSMLTRIDTKNYNYMDLSKEIHIDLGEFSTECDFTPSLKGRNDYAISAKINIKSLMNKIDVIPSMLEEVLLNSKFDNKERILQIIRENKSRLEMMIMQAGHVVAITQARAQLRPEYDFYNQTSNLAYYKFVAELEKDFESKYQDIQAKLTDVYNKIYRKGQLKIAISGEHQDNIAVMKQVDKFVGKLAQQDLAPQILEPAKDIKHIGLGAPINVQYVGLICDYEAVGMEYKGQVNVLNNLIPSGYLYNNIRVQGGAYGAIFNIGDGGHFSLVSYRDPNLERTYDVYKGIPEFLDTLEVSKSELTKQIIGSIASMDVPLTASVKLNTARVLADKNLTPEMRQQNRKELLATSLEDLKAYSSMFKQVLENGVRVTVGNSAKIEENKELFDLVSSIF